MLRAKRKQEIVKFYLNEQMPGDRTIKPETIEQIMEEINADCINKNKEKEH